VPPPTGADQGQGGLLVRSEFIPTPADITILTVLSGAGRSLLNAEIVRDAATMRQEKRKARQQTPLVLLSEDCLSARIPLLLDAGLVARPLGPNGKPMMRKGVGITEKGYGLLKRATGQPPA
jgi:hypothetical protein